MDSNARLFGVSFLKFDATKYNDMIDRQAFKVTELSVTKNMPNIELQRIIAAQESPKYLFPQFPCHTLAVEECY